MPLFRFHRGGLSESLATTVIVKTIDDLAGIISGSLDLNVSWPARISIQPYPAGDNFDKRIGWYTHLVTANIHHENIMHPIGYLSEPLNDALEPDWKMNKRNVDRERMQ